MFQFILSTGAILELYAKTRLKIRFNNPAFEEKLQTGSYILPFALPDTAGNQKALGFLNQASSRGVVSKSYPCDLWIGGLYFASGLLYVNAFRNEGYSCDFSLDTGAFTKLVGNTGLRSDLLAHDTHTFMRNVPYTYGYRHFFQGSPNEFNGSTYKMLMTLVNTDATYTNVLNTFNSAIETDYFETNNDAEVTRKAEWLRLFANKINKRTDIPAKAHSAAYHFSLEGTGIGSGAFYYFAVQITYLVTGQPTVVTLYPVTLTSQNILDVAFEYPDFVFPRIENTKFYESSKAVDEATFKFKNSVFAGVVNQDIIKNYILNQPQLVLRPNVLPAAYTVDNDLYDAGFHNIVPFLKIGYVFAKIAQFTNYSFSGTFLTDIELQSLIVYNNYALDKIDDTAPFEGTNVYDEQMDYANHLPDIKIKEFMLQVASLFNFFYVFDFRRNTSALVFRQDLLTAVIVDWSDKFLTEYEASVQEPKNKIVGYESSSLPEGYENALPAATIGNYAEGEEVNYACGTLPYRIDTNFTFTVYTIDNGVGNSPFPVYNVGTDNKYPLRLLFWRGYRGAGKALYSATSYPYDSNKYGLEWEGEKGLAEKFHKKWVAFIQSSQIVKRKAILTLADLYQLDLTKRYAIDFQTYLIKSIEIEISNGADTLPAPADIELVQIK